MTNKLTINQIAKFSSDISVIDVHVRANLPQHLASGDRVRLLSALVRVTDLAAQLMKTEVKVS